MLTNMLGDALILGFGAAFIFAMTALTSDSRYRVTRHENSCPLCKADVVRRTYPYKDHADVKLICSSCKARYEYTFSYQTKMKFEDDVRAHIGFMKRD